MNEEYIQQLEEVTNNAYAGEGIRPLYSLIQEMKPDNRMYAQGVSHLIQAYKEHPEPETVTIDDLAHMATPYTDALTDPFESNMMKGYFSYRLGTLETPMAPIYTQDSIEFYKKALEHPSSKENISVALNKFLPKNGKSAIPQLKLGGLHRRFSN
jgi:hypothetical protein